MSASPSTREPPAPSAEFASAFQYPIALAGDLMRSQQAQMQALIEWQTILAGIHQELWDEWVAHWGGGVPIDV